MSNFLAVQDDVNGVLSMNSRNGIHFLGKPRSGLSSNDRIIIDLEGLIICTGYSQHEIKDRHPARNLNIKTWLFLIANLLLLHHPLRHQVLFVFGRPVIHHYWRHHFHFRVDVMLSLL